MITLRKSNERGKTITDWLTSYHSFSFNRYYDPEHVGFGPLVVINDDVVKPGKGFGLHPHENMEIVTYVLTGALEHKDSTGKREVLHAGEVGRMSAGTGIVHSEYNHSQTEIVRLLQIWFYPKEEGMTPSHEQKTFTDEQRRNVLLPVASDNAGLGGTLINSNATMYVSKLKRNHILSYDLIPGRSGYVFVAEGRISINDLTLHKGDAALVTKEDRIQMNAIQESEIVLFDVALST